jgi:hypothetical protein
MVFRLPRMSMARARGCVGHLLRTAKGFRACDANDKEIGTYPTPEAGVAHSAANSRY